jgi:hypothetical protein
MHVLPTGVIPCIGLITHTVRVKGTFQIQSRTWFITADSDLLNSYTVEAA